MADIGKLLLFAGTIALAMRVALTTEAVAKKRATVEFVLVVAGLSIVAGLFRLDAWPYTRYPMIMYVTPGAETTEIVVRAADARGVESAVDPFSFSPLFPTAFAAWIERAEPRLNSRERDEALAYLLSRTRRSRTRIAAGGRIGSAAWLGALAAPPDWGLYRHPGAGDSIETLRVYRTRWRLDTEKQWTLIAEFPKR